jgi:DNA polymerase
VFVCNTLKCRPPGNRDPQPNEIESCSGYLHSQVQLIEPKLICTLGNFSTKLLRGDATGISRLHGQVQEQMIGPRAVRLYPLYHPAAALYTPSTLEALRADFHRIPNLLALEPLAQPEPLAPIPEPELEESSEPEAASEQAVEPATQLDLF